MKEPPTALEQAAAKSFEPGASTFVDVDELFDTLSANMLPLTTRSSIGFAASKEQDTQIETADELFDAIEAREFVRTDSRTEVFTESLEASVGYSSLIRQLNESVRTRITFFMSEAGGSLSHEDARKAAFKRAENSDEARSLFKQMARLPADSLSFSDLAQLWNIAPRAAESLWKTITSEGRKEFESGHLAANSIFPTAQLKTAWKVAQYLGMRESFIDEWKPKNGIEIGLIDMMAQAYCQWQFWLEQTVLRSQTAPRQEHVDYRRWKSHNARANKEESWDDGFWFPPYVEEKEALEQAVQMADRWNRMFVRTLRQLRDLRRYSPVTINNPKQVNIATDGAKQANIAE